MGNHWSSEKGVDQQEIQGLVKKYWVLKRSVEDQTVRFLGCVDVLESASAHILSCDDKNNGDQIKNFSLNPQARKLLCSSMAIEKDVKQSFVNEIDHFVEFISKEVGKLQTDSYRKCEIQSKYLPQLNDWESKLKEEPEKKPEDAMKKRIEDLQKQIDNRDEIIKTLKEENEVLCGINDTYVKTNEEKMCKLDSSLALHEENKKLKKKLDSLDMEKNKLNEKVKALGEINELQKKNLDECDSKIVILELQVKHEYEEERSKMRYEIEQLKKTEAERQAEISTLEERRLCEIEELKKTMTEERHSEVTTLKEESKQQLKDKVDLIQSLMTQHEKDKKEIADIKANLSTKLNEHADEINENYDKNCELERKLKECGEKIKTIQTEKNSVDDKLNKMQKELSSEKWKNEENKSQHIRLETSLEESNRKLSEVSAVKTELEKEIARIKVELDQCNNEKKEVNNRLTHYKTKKRETERNLHSVLEKCGDLETESQQLHDKYDSCLREKDALQSELEQKLKSNEKQYLVLQSNYKTLQNNERKMKDDLQACHSKINTLSKNLEEYRFDNKKLSDELSAIHSKRIIKVKLFAIRRPSTLADFEDAVMAMLKSRIDDDVRELVFEQNDNPDVVNADTDATILLCFCGSRIGTDAEKSVEGLNLSPKMALVMIHHKDVHALPSQLSERVITGPEYKKLHLITDMAFLRDKGIFPCEINNNSVVKLVNFIKTEGKEYKKY